MTLEIVPITFDDACTFVRLHHRHHKAPRGWKFGTAVSDGVRIVGVVMVGRPVSRHLDDGFTLEVTRCCTDGTEHVASMLYAAARRACKALGYKKLVTYILETEKGVSLKAAGWVCLYESAGGSWSRSDRPRLDKHPTGQKTLWCAPR